jgi:hypothetical protein
VQHGGRGVEGALVHDGQQGPHLVERQVGHHER